MALQFKDAFWVSEIFLVPPRGGVSRQMWSWPWLFPQRCEVFNQFSVVTWVFLSHIPFKICLDCVYSDKYCMEVTFGARLCLIFVLIFLDTCVLLFHTFKPTEGVQQKIKRPNNIVGNHVHVVVFFFLTQAKREAKLLNCNLCCQVKCFLFPLDCSVCKFKLDNYKNEHHFFSYWQ